MSQHFRLAKGGHIDRTRPLAFCFDGKPYVGYAGDTLASALLANGVKMVGRSFKFHRPRGILSAGVEEPNALLGVDTGVGMIPVSRATLVPLLAGLVAESQNSFPSLAFDVGRILDYTRPLWPAGFYNKIFKWPNWQVFEGVVRRMAGLGRLPGGEDNCRYRHMNAHCDLLVVGAGSAGLQSALEAGRRGDDVIIVEQDVAAGGSLLYDPAVIDGKAPHNWLQAILLELHGMENVRLMLRATVAGYYDHNVLTVHDRSCAWRGGESLETFWTVRARDVVLATGAIEQPLMFGNNDLPGIMLAGAVHQYAARYAVRCGEQIVGIVNNDFGWRSLLASSDAGAKLSVILDVRGNVDVSLQGEADARGISVQTRARPVRARGSKSVRAIEFLTADGSSDTIECDAIAMSGGMNPTLHLYSQAGGKLRYDDSLGCFLPYECRQSVAVTGAAGGNFATANDYNIAPRTAAQSESSKQWVDFAHDVTVSDIELAVRENFESVEHLKRYTTTGMAVDQGKTSNINALTLLGQLTGRSPGEVGTTTFRPQFMPVTLGAIAGQRRGQNYLPARLMPAHDWHGAHEAVFEDYGDWKRPAYYGAGDRTKIIAAEAMHVRNSVGLLEASPLGKIEVKGPDAAEFLSRMYVNTVHTLKVGKVRYGLMLNENGVVIDDGVFVRIADDHFLVNTTSANSDLIAAWFEEWHQCEWPQLKVVFSIVTSQWGVATVAGPNARDVLEKLPGMISLSTEAFPLMSFMQGTLDDGTPYRIQRVSYTGEMSYELSVPASNTTDLLERIWAEGSANGIALFGVEAMDLLRTEKGFLHVGADTDITTNPFDIGFTQIVKNKKSDFIGARSLRRENDCRDDRRQFVGFETKDAKATIRAGAHFSVGAGVQSRSQGFVTSACHSPTLGKTIGLGLLGNGFSRIGEDVMIFDDGKVISARVVQPGFYDKNGERMRA